MKRALSKITAAVAIAETKLIEGIDSIFELCSEYLRKKDQKMLRLE